MRTYADYPMRTGTVLGFSTSPTEYLDYIRQDLGLVLPLENLSYIQNHYRLIEKRDCDVTELILIDILFGNVNERLRRERNYSISEMVTDSDDIRETMEDMMAKLALMEKKTVGPISLERLMNVSSSYIASIFPERAAEHFSAKYVGEEESALRSMLEGSRETMQCTAGELKFAVASSSVKKAIKEGYYIQIKNNGELVPFVDELLKNGIIFNGWMIDTGLLSAVLSDTVSAEIIVPESLPEMATYGSGDILLLCREKDEMDIVRIGMERGLQMRRAGRRNKKGKILFKSKNLTTAIAGEFLRKFAHAEIFTPVNLKVGEEILSGNVNCKLNELSCDKSIGDLSAVCALSDMNSPYKSGISQVICAAAGEIALGAAIEDIRLKSVISCPKDTDPGAIFAHILGIYRARIELCISSHDNELHVSDDIDKISSVSIALANVGVKGNFGEGRLFAVSPEDKDGKICFDNIRKTFSYVSALIESGHVIRACALDSEGLSDGSEDKMTFTAGAFLILSDAELLGCEGVSVKNVGVVGTENTLPIV